MTDSEFRHLDETLERLDPDTALLRVFLEPERRSGALALLALRAQLREIPAFITEPDVARAKIGWWREEWQRLREGVPRHPVTRSLAAGLSEDAPDLAPALHALLEALELGSWETLDELEAWAGRLAQPLARLEAALAGGRGSHDEPGWRRLLVYTLVLDLPQWWSLGRTVVPLSLCARSGIGRDRLAGDREARGSMQSLLAAEVLERYTALPAPMSNLQAIDEALKRHRLRALRDGKSPGRLMALSRLFCAWSAARRARRVGAA